MQYLNPLQLAHRLSAENHHRHGTPLSDQVHVRYLVAQYVIHYDTPTVIDVPEGQYNQYVSV